jgi:hypothetical protein
MRAYAAAAERPAGFAAAGALLRFIPWKLGGRALPVVGGWSAERTPPEPSAKPFHKLWKEGIE